MRAFAALPKEALPLHRRYLVAGLAVLAAVPAAYAVADATAACETWIPVATPPLPLPQPSGACPGIRPGARMDAPSGCTYNFVFQDAASKLYIGTAGHCVSAAGDRVSAAGIGEFGTVRYAIAQDVGTDFALIEIDADKYAQVTPAMCHWGGPTAADDGAAPLGTGTKQYGHGVVLGQNDATRARQGELIVWESAYWRATHPVTGGDSGSPMMLADGRAAGVVTHLSFSFSYPDHPESAASTSSGTRLQRAIALAEGATGLDLTLLTAPLAA